MAINSVASTLPLQGLNQIQSVNNAASTDQTSGASFGDFLNQAIEKVNDQQVSMDSMSEALATGQAPDLHTVMIASEKATLSFQMAVQVRNKALEAYQEIMRMQM